MKKLRLLVIPLMAIPFLASCANAGGGGGDDPKEKEWYEDTTYINSLTDADVTKEGGEIKTLKVNGLDHKVRLIGVDKDVDSEGNTIHTTWEFANLISDANGNSLATQWNDTNDENTANHNYLDSSVRMALVGEKQELGHILWAQKGATTWSTDSLYKDKCVLDMLPSELVSVLKAPSKYINIYNTDETKWEEKTVNDKLFLLSPREMGHEDEYQESSTTTYSYYEGATRYDRIKKQFNDRDVCTNTPWMESGSTGQEYQDQVASFAGYNPSSDSAGNGGYYWLRSPNDSDAKYAWNVGASGTPENSREVYKFAFPVAPAFCI